MTDLRNKIEGCVERAILDGGFGEKEATDAILALLRDSVKPLEWEYVTLNVYHAVFAGRLYRKIGRSDGTWALRIDTDRYDTKTANSEAAIDEYARENVVAHIFSALGIDT